MFMGEATGATGATGATVNTVATSPVESANGDILDAKVFICCLALLPMDDIKGCRLVCRNWRAKVNPILKQRSCVVIHGEDTGSLFRDGAVEKCLKYLTGSVTKFSLWNSLRMKQVKDHQIRLLLASRNFQIAAKSILELELVRCDFHWNSLLKLMKQFMNLQTFYDKKTNFKEADSSILASLSLWNSSKKPEGPIESNFVRKEICLEDLKCLKIYKSNSGRNTTDLIKILTVTTVDLEEIHLKLDPQQKQITVKDVFEFERHLNILFLLNAKSLKKMYVDMMDTDHIEYFNDFLNCFRDWSTASSNGYNDEFAMEELVLKFKYIWLSKSFETILIPWVSRLTNLKVLGLGSICFKPETAYLLDTLGDALPPDCVYEFGLCVSDHCGNDNAEENRALGISILTSDLYRQHMTDLLIGVFHDDVTQVIDLIPMDLESPQYEKMVDLCVFTSGPNRPKFTSFNIKHLTYFFDNVTSFEIIDGPYENYFERFFKTTSSAFIDDEDIQLIIKCMKKLQKLIVFANMEMLTDSGVTGLAQTICYRMRTTKNYHLEPQEVMGYRFEHLKNLRYLSLRGIGTSLTDVSAYWGFSNMKNLKTLIVANCNKITPEGREFLHRMYPESEGCFVALL